MGDTTDGPVSACAIAFDRTVADRVVITVRGDFDLGAVPEHSERLRAASREGRHLVVDLRATGFLDSSGLAVLMNAARRTTVAGLHLLVVCAAGPALRVLEMTGLVGTLRVLPDIEEAHRLIDAAPTGPDRGRQG